MDYYTEQRTTENKAERGRKQPQFVEGTTEEEGLWTENFTDKNKKQVLTVGYST